MNEFIANSSADKPLGIPTGRKCFILPQGQYAGRMAILYAANANTIKLVISDPPYTSFSTPIDVVTNAADAPFDAAFSFSYDIVVAFTGNSTTDLRFIRLSFSGGSWTPGTQKVVYDGAATYDPVIRKLTTGQVWIFYTRLSAGDYYISGKYSGDDGDSWSASSDPGDTLTSGAGSACSMMVERNKFQYVFYTEGGTKIAYCQKANDGLFWGSEVVLATEGGYGEDFHAAVSPDGRIGLAYVSSSGLKFREYNGSYWASEATLDEGNLANPFVSYQGGEAYVIYTKNVGDAMQQAFSVMQDDSGFTDPEELDVRRSDLKAVIVYNSSAGTYQDKTAEAASSATADVFHSNSGALLSETDDAVFFGAERPFNFLHMILSTTGAGGLVVWKYWDGQNWQSFSPVSGTWHFTSAVHDLLFWNDFNDIPANWQKKKLSGHECFWIAATVSTAFATAPVGSRLNAASNLKALSIRE